MYVKIAIALNKHKKAVNGSNILFIGVAFKPDIDDARKSPALEIMDITAYKGGNVSYHDPYIPQVKTNGSRTYTSTKLSAESLAQADCVVLTTNHKDFDVELITKNTNLIVVMRNLVKGSNGKAVKL